MWQKGESQAGVDSDSSGHGPSPAQQLTFHRAGLQAGFLTGKRGNKGPGERGMWLLALEKITHAVLGQPALALHLGSGELFVGEPQNLDLQIPPTARGPPHRPSPPWLLPKGRDLVSSDVVCECACAHVFVLVP